jgi:hypothetical protein
MGCSVWVLNPGRDKGFTSLQKRGLILTTRLHLAPKFKTEWSSAVLQYDFMAWRGTAYFFVFIPKIGYVYLFLNTIIWQQ